jgi:hypothetical protein
MNVMEMLQVSMAQNMSAELKNASNSGVSIASQQGIYMTGSQDSPGSSYCSVSQSQTINFTQQSLRQRTPQRQQQHQLIRTSHPVSSQLIVATINYNHTLYFFI